MGWVFFHKPKGKKAIATMREQLGEDWCAKHVVAESATREAVFFVVKRHSPNDNVYVPDADGFIRGLAVIKIKSGRGDYNFGYKDMSESMGPVGCECPPAIIEAASPLRDPVGPEMGYSSLRSARAYRERSIKVYKLKALKRSLKPGAIVTTAHAVSNYGGTPINKFTVVKTRVRNRKGIGTYFRSVVTGGLYSIPAADLGGAVVE